LRHKPTHGNLHCNFPGQLPNRGKKGVTYAVPRHPR